MPPLSRSGEAMVAEVHVTEGLERGEREQGEEGTNRQRQLHPWTCDSNTGIMGWKLLHVPLHGEV
jgi:hypothetical protein